MAEGRGVNIFRGSDTSFTVFAVLWDSDNAKITSGSTDLRIWHIISSSGVLETYDFNDDTFKTGAVTTESVSMTHRTVENGGYNSGVWTYRHTTLTDFESGEKYIFEISHTDLPRSIQYYVQYGDLEGDQYTLA